MPPRPSRPHRRPVHDEGRGVVEQRLAFDQDRDDARDAEAAEHGGRGEGVGRRHDRPEREGGRPPEAGDEGLGDQRDRDRVHDHEAERQACDRPEVRSQVTERDLERGPEQERGQEHEQHDIRLDRDVREPGTNPSTTPPTTNSAGYGTRTVPRPRTGT